jgi:hypothetical protein
MNLSSRAKRNYIEDRAFLKISSQRQEVRETCF